LLLFFVLVSYMFHIYFKICVLLGSGTQAQSPKWRRAWVAGWPLLLFWALGLGRGPTNIQTHEMKMKHICKSCNLHLFDDFVYIYMYFIFPHQFCSYVSHSSRNSRFEPSSWVMLVKTLRGSHISIVGCYRWN
jgi:hypothetical protein